MARDKYIRLTVDGQELEIGSVGDLNLNINYSLEDRDNFQEKTSNTAYNVVVPATLQNDKIANTYHNPSVDDLSTGNVYRNIRKGMIEVNGDELLNGKAFLENAKHDLKPKDYTFNFYGSNADWLIDLKDSTLYDFLKDLNIPFDKAHMINSWRYDGRDPNLSWVFAPVRYGAALDSMSVTQGAITQLKQDYNMKPNYLKPALSKYWILYKGFKSLGYKINSTFLDSVYFRRQVMPWTFGDLFYHDGSQFDSLNFLAKSTGDVTKTNQNGSGFLDTNVTNHSTDGAFDTNGVYSYSGGTTLTWTYPTRLNYGLLNIGLHLSIFADTVATANSDIEIRVQWFVNGVKQVSNSNDNGNGTELVVYTAPNVGAKTFQGNAEDWFNANVKPGDTISAKIYWHEFTSGLGRTNMHVSVDEFNLDFINVPLGGTLIFSNYTNLKNWKWLDFLAGVIDEFNLIIQTDTRTKTVYIEPQHPYATGADMTDLQPGYMTGKTLDWTDKEDLSREWQLDLYNDIERELIFSYKDDSNDGALKILTDRHLSPPAKAKYLLPERFKAGQSPIENRFFSPVVHYDVERWRGLAADYPQMIAIVPENISNTSASESDNTFEPKSAYYKGLIPGTGWVFDDTVLTSFPSMFAVNYRQGGEADPCLSYNDEQVGITGTVARGLLRRFYLQRLEIMRNGQFYNPAYFHLKSSDLANFLHREYIIARGEKWEVVQIVNYNPVSDDSTEVYLRKWSPIRSV